MKFKDILIGTIAATTLFTGAATYSSAQASTTEEFVIPEGIGVEQSEYNTYEKLFSLVKRNGDNRDPKAKIYYKDGTDEEMDLQKLPETEKGKEKITKEIDKIEYTHPDGTTSTINANQLDWYLPKTWGELYETLGEIYDDGDELTITDGEGKQITFTIGKDRPENPEKRVGSVKIEETKVKHVETE